MNAISPGTIVTPILENSAGLTREQAEAYWASEGPKAPAGRAGRADEIATAALFFASDESSFVTGVDLPVDGGYTQV